MASSLKLYVTGLIMEDAVCTAASDEASGHPKELVYDNNLDTYWKPIGDTLDQVTFDMTKVIYTNAICVFLKNYKSFTAGTMKVYYSDNGSTWYAIGGNPNLADSTTPLRIYDYTFGSHRYWRLWFQNYSHVPEVAAVWWARIYTINLGDVLPEEDGEQFYNRMIQLPGGRLAVPGFNRNLIEHFNRRYLIKSGNADLTDLRDTFQASFGRRSPLVMNEGAAQANARVVRFADDIFVRRLADHQVYEAQIRLEGIPYIDDGVSY